MINICIVEQISEGGNEPPLCDGGTITDCVDILGTFHLQSIVGNQRLGVILTLYLAGNGLDQRIGANS